MALFGGGIGRRRRPKPIYMGGEVTTMMMMGRTGKKAFTGTSLDLN
jgi:hypothetical protein